jgi:hypothetical protein
MALVRSWRWRSTLGNSGRRWRRMGHRHRELVHGILPYSRGTNQLATKRRPPRFPRAIRGRRRDLCRNGSWRDLQRDDITASCGEINDPIGRLIGEGGALLGAMSRAMIDDYSAEVRPKQKAA